jgi:hypothetical protein
MRKELAEAQSCLAGARQQLAVPPSNNAQDSAKPPP